MTSDTPGFGALVKLATRRRGGAGRYPARLQASPVGGETLDLPRQLGINSGTPLLGGLATAAMGDRAATVPPAIGQNVYEKAQIVGEGLGAGSNPLADILAYKTGITRTPPAGLERLAPVGQLADQFLATKGGPLWENVLGTAMAPDGKPGDFQQQLDIGRYVDPAAIRAGNELDLRAARHHLQRPQERRPGGAAQRPVERLLQGGPDAGLRRQGGDGGGGRADPGRRAGDHGDPGGRRPRARMDLIAQGLPLTRAQQQAVAADPKQGGAIVSQAYQARLDAAKLQNPALAVQDVGTPEALGNKVFDAVEARQRRPRGLPARLQPAGRAGAGAARPGPAGDGDGAAAALRPAGQRAGLRVPGLGPGVPRPPFDPTPLYDLMRYLNGGR